MSETVKEVFTAILVIYSLALTAFYCFHTKDIEVNIKYIRALEGTCGARCNIIMARHAAGR